MHKYLTLLLVFTMVCWCVAPAMAGVKDDADSLRAEADALRADADALDAEADTLQGQADAIQENLDAAAGELAGLQTTLDDATQAYDDAKAAWEADKGNSDLKAAKNAAYDDKQDAQAALNTKQSEVDGLQSDLNSKNSDVQAKRDDAADKRGQADAKDAEANSLDSILSEEPFVFQEKLDDFLGTNLGGGTYYGDELKNNEINSLVSHVEKNAEDYAKLKNDERNIEGVYQDQSANYFNEAVAKYQDMMPVFSANNDKPGIDDVREQYEKEISDFVKGYADDMINPPKNEDGSLRFTFDDYRNDFNSLNEFIQTDIDNLGAVPEETEMGDRLFDPVKMMDRAVEGNSRGAVKVELGWVGVQGKGLSGNNLYDVLQSVKGKFGSNQALKDDMEWFKDTWQSQENGINDLAVKQTTAAYAQTGNSGGSTTNSWVVNQYGDLVPSDQQAMYENDLGKAGEALGSYVKNERYNNRSHGYRYTNGTYNVAKVTVGKKQYVMQHTVFTSPIVLDMDNDGELEASNGNWLPHNYEGGKVVEFDINGDGFVELIEWVGPNDGLLILYTEGMTQVTGNELFGEAGGWFDGYHKMKLYDADQNMVLEGDELAEMSIWQDKNGNVLIDEGEVSSLADLNITSLNINHNRMVSSFVQDDETKTMWDWYPVTLQVKPSKQLTWIQIRKFIRSS